MLIDEEKNGPDSTIEARWLRDNETGEQVLVCGDKIIAKLKNGVIIDPSAEE